MLPGLGKLDLYLKETSGTFNLYNQQPRTFKFSVTDHGCVIWYSFHEDYLFLNEQLSSVLGTISLFINIKLTKWLFPHQFVFNVFSSNYLQIIFIQFHDPKIRLKLYHQELENPPTWSSSNIQCITTTQRPQTKEDVIDQNSHIHSHKP